MCLWMQKAPRQHVDPAEQRDECVFLFSQKSLWVCLFCSFFSSLSLDQNSWLCFLWSRPEGGGYKVAGF